MSSDDNESGALGFFEASPATAWVAHADDEIGQTNDSEGRKHSLSEHGGSTSSESLRAEAWLGLGHVTMNLSTLLSKGRTVVDRWFDVTPLKEKNSSNRLAGLDLQMRLRIIFKFPSRTRTTTVVSMTQQPKHVDAEVKVQRRDAILSTLSFLGIPATLDLQPAKLPFSQNVTALKFVKHAWTRAHCPEDEDMESVSRSRIELERHLLFRGGSSSRWIPERAPEKCGGRAGVILADAMRALSDSSSPWRQVGEWYGTGFGKFLCEIVDASLQLALLEAGVGTARCSDTHLQLVRDLGHRLGFLGVSTLANVGELARVRK